MPFLTKHKQMVSVAGSIAVLTLIFVATWPDLESGADTDISANERWEFGVVERPQQPDVDALLESGFWGDITAPVTEEITQQPELMAEEEAAEIRKRIYGIVTSDGGSEKLAVIYEAERLTEGDVLSDTGWEIVSVSRDRLILDQPGQGPKELRLFHDNTFTVTESVTAEEEKQQ